jgi:hypothetical protein
MSLAQTAMTAEVCPKPAACLQTYPHIPLAYCLSPCVACLQVTALETRALQLQADEEVAAVTAGPEAQAAAAHALQQAQAALTAVERVSAISLSEGYSKDRQRCLLQRATELCDAGSSHHFRSSHTVAGSPPVLKSNLC